MSQATKSVQVPTFGTRWATPRNASVIGAGVLALVVAAAIAIGSLNSAPAIIANPAVANAPLSRLDDYGLRHPAGVQTTTDSRLDDYGLRHPAAVQTTTDSRLDDYGLRHPNR